MSKMTKNTFTTSTQYVNVHLKKEYLHLLMNSKSVFFPYFPPFGITNFTEAAALTAT